MSVMQFDLLFRIECLHAYFRGGPCRGLALVPTDDCRELLAGYQMLFRPAGGGGVVYYSQQSASSLPAQFDETAAFTFTLTSSDPALNNYTDVDLGQIDPADSIFHFDNSADYAQEAFGQSRQLLHQPGKPFAGAAVPVRPGIFTYIAPKTIRSGNLKVIEPLGKQVMWQLPLPAAGAPAQVDLRKFSEGLYLLQLNDDPPQRFYLSDQPAVRRWGVVSIYIGGVNQGKHLAANCKVLGDDGAIHARTFTLALESRQTIWRYYIIPSTERNFDNCELVSASKKTNGSNGASEVSFALLPKTQSVDGRTAWVFESQSPLPFLQSPAQFFSLTLRPNKNGKLGQRAIRLPYAQAGSMVVKENTEPRQMCSEIFVYV